MFEENRRRSSTIYERKHDECAALALVYAISSTKTEDQLNERVDEPNELVYDNWNNHLVTTELV